MKLTNPDTMTDIGEIEDPAPRGEMSLFPLPLTPFELMMWFDHRPEYPMVFPMVCEFTGEVDRECAEQALDVVCARHPLLSARVESNRRQRFWVASADRLNRINWDARTTIQQRPIDLRHEPGVLVEFHVTPGRAVMTWHFHHCCCDGVSAVAVVVEWLLIYHALATGTDWQAMVQPLEPLALIHRAQLRNRKRHQSAASTARRFSWRKLWSEAWTGLRVLRTRPEPLAGRMVAANGRRAEVLVQHLDVETTARLRNVAASRQGNLNDLLLTSLFLTMQRWNRDFRSRRGPSSYRVTMPTNQRIPQDRRLPAANVMSYAMIDRRVDDRTDGDELVGDDSARDAGHISIQPFPAVCRHVGLGSQIPLRDAVVSAPRKLLVVRRFEQCGRARSPDSSACQV